MGVEVPDDWAVAVAEEGVESRTLRLGAMVEESAMIVLSCGVCLAGAQLWWCSRV